LELELVTLTVWMLNVPETEVWQPEGEDWANAVAARARMAKDFMLRRAVGLGGDLTDVGC
jgi:hypothetical protein